MDQRIKDRLTNESIWKRILSMLVLGIAYSLAETVLIILVVGQVLYRLISGDSSDPLRAMGKSLADYLYQIFLFLTFNSEYRPFPFAAWSDEGQSRVIESAAVMDKD